MEQRTIKDQMIVTNKEEKQESHDEKMPPNDVMFSGILESQQLAASAKHWIGDVELLDGQALMVFENTSLKGQPAVAAKTTIRDTPKLL